MNDLVIQSKIRDYKVVFENSIVEVSKALATLPNKVLIVDANVLEIYRQEICAMADAEDIVAFEALEDNKDLNAVSEIYASLIDRNAKRNINLVSIGGGITQDVTGFVASTLYRGLNWTFVPTTFLAQTDSCIGSKTSLNFRNRKNLLGTFYPPCQILLCPAFLSSLSEIDYFSGIGETIKFQLMNPFTTPDLKTIGQKIERVKRYEYLDEVIRENMAVKINFMENDEFDLGRRNLLNYGHCFGHALEIASNYAIPHGIAVSIGILFAGIVSVNRGMMSRERFDAIRKIVLPCVPLAYDARHYDAEMLLSALKNDKKRTGSKLTIVLSDEDFGLQKYDDLEENEFTGALLTLNEILEKQPYEQC
jgi:3-dehydroquinate synthase